MSKIQKAIVILIVTAPLAIGSGMVLWVVWKLDSYNGLTPPYSEDEWEEVLSLLGFASICLSWIVSFLVTIKTYWKNKSKMT